MKFNKYGIAVLYKESRPITIWSWHTLASINRGYSKTIQMAEEVQSPLKWLVDNNKIKKHGDYYSI